MPIKILALIIVIALVSAGVTGFLFLKQKSFNSLNEISDEDVLLKIKSNIETVKTVHSEILRESALTISEDEPNFSTEKSKFIHDYDFENNKYQMIMQDAGLPLPTKTVVIGNDGIYSCLLQEGRKCNKSEETGKFSISDYLSTWNFTKTAGAIEKVSDKAEIIDGKKCLHYKVNIQRRPFPPQPNDTLGKTFFYMLGIDSEKPKEGPYTDEEIVKLKLKLTDKEIKFFTTNNQEVSIPIPQTITNPILYLSIGVTSPDDSHYQVNIWSIAGDIWVAENTFQVVKERYMVERTSYYYDVSKPAKEAYAYRLSTKITDEVLYSDFDKKVSIEPTVEVGNEYYQAKKIDFNTKSPVDLVEIGKECKKATNPVEVGGKLAYICAGQENGKSFIVYNGQEIGKEYADINDHGLMDIGGKLAFQAWKKEHLESPVIYWGGEELGNQYKLIMGPVGVNGIPAFSVTNNPGVDPGFISYNGQEIGKEYSAFVGGGSAIGEIKEINKKIAYKAKMANSQNGFIEFVVFDGQEIGKEYDRVFDFIDVNGKLFYTASKNNKRFAIFDGKQSGPYDDVEFPVAIGNKVAYRAKIGEKELIVYDGQEIGKEYDSVAWPANVNGKLAFEATKSGKSFIVYDDKEIGKEYTYIFSPLEINGKLAFVADKIASYPKVEQRIIYYGGQEFGFEYDSAENPVEVAGKLAFVAVKDGKTFIVMEK